ncbi:MAG: leucine-rich repeat domain-containing protein [Candidatus Endonucleobacter bathymodioli]|uniref:Leucine-rich repeat domain-containing protein n=1 Tax=Candidatus Endonucleibacter bathymodioli TaxID=539814 RepID=A0AA90SD78_9GAMM|nr:leucine-rich repeat domain-containing protein [Candidatus Endonucleobacter bathymodioli]
MKSFHLVNESTKFVSGHEDYRCISDKKLIERFCSLCNIKTYNNIIPENIHGYAHELASAIKEKINDMSLQYDTENYLEDGGINEGNINSDLARWVDEATGEERGARISSAKIIINNYRAKNKSLILIGLKLTSMPECILRFKHLERLDISDNDLTSLPRGWENLTNLNYLDMSSNSFEKLPDALIKLRSSVYVCIAFNNIKSIDQEMRFLIKEKECSIEVLGELKESIESFKGRPYLTSRWLEILGKNVLKSFNLVNMGSDFKTMKEFFSSDDPIAAKYIEKIER